MNRSDSLRIGSTAVIYVFCLSHFAAVTCPTAKSCITQLEYEAALKHGIDILPLVLEEDAPWWAAFDERNNDPEIAQWRSELRKRHGVQPFNLEPHSIDMTGALGRWLTKRNNLQQEQKTTTETRPEVTRKVTWDIETDGSPYPGLLHFTRHHARVFFGRDDEIREVLYRMQKPEGRFIIVSGDSGVGKSSVVDAGILPRLEDGALPEGERCVCVRMMPGQGNQPFAALMTALGSYVTRVGLRPDAVIQDMKRSSESFVEQIRKIISGWTDGKQLVLFVDQMEELFTAQDVGESNKVLTHLYRAAQEKALWVIATIRSDHLHFCHRHPEMLGVLKGSGHYPLGPVASYMMTDMIVKPAECAGLTVSENLARRIVGDTLAFRNLESAESDSANLPLLAFVLNQLFLKRSDDSLSDDAYKTMGGIAGAIVEHVEAVEKELEQLGGAKAIDHLGKIFYSLVSVREEGPPTRNRPLLADFDGELRPSVKVLVDARLLRAEGEGAASTVSVSHEKLFEAWPALRDYISANKKALMDKGLLNSRARKWADIGKPWFSGLASRRECKDFRHSPALSSRAKEYLSASARARWVMSGAFALLWLGIFLFVYVDRQWQAGLSTKQSLLKLRHYVKSIHLEPEMVLVSAGSFRMVGTGGKDVHDVKFQKAFKLSKYEVTFNEYDRFAVATGRKLPDDQSWGRGRRPVINVDHKDAKEYATWLSERTGKSYRTPSEAEWEYAARSRGNNDQWAGTNIESELEKYAWFSRNSKGKTQVVGTKEKNELGLYDMSGNVWEWVEDCWHENFNGAPFDGQAWKPENGGQCGPRVIRGGSWFQTPVHLRSSSRARFTAPSSSLEVGFRLAQDIE